MKLGLLALAFSACARVPVPQTAPPTEAETACLGRYVDAVHDCGAEVTGESRCRYDAGVSYRVCSRMQVVVER